MNFELNTTYGNGSWMEQFHQVIAMKEDPGRENQVINLYPEAVIETIEGFGGAFTDSAAYVYSLMNDAQKEEFLHAYFDEDRMNYRIARIHMDSCDFSLEQYEAMSDPADTELKSFSMERTEKYIFPMLRDAERVAGRKLELMLSPWSPPCFMKTNGERSHCGQLKPEYRALWAEYMCRYIEEFRARGFVVKRMSLQNEPKAVQSWDSCIFTAAEQKAFLRDYMWPAMEKHGLTDVEVFIWDHNKERAYEWLRDIVDEETDKMVAGTAFHWYSGDHFEALQLAKKMYPDKKLIISESCIEFSKFSAGDDSMNAIRLSHEMIGDLNNGMSAFYDWNLLLDEQGGPNHVGNFCLAPFHFDTKTKVLKPQLLQQYFEHFTNHLVPGSQVIVSTKYTEDLDVVAAKRPDGTIAVVILNKASEVRAVNLRVSDQLAEFILYPKSITSGVISK